MQGLYFNLTNGQAKLMATFLKYLLSYVGQPSRYERLKGRFLKNYSDLSAAAAMFFSNSIDQPAAVTNPSK